MQTNERELQHSRTHKPTDTHTHISVLKKTFIYLQVIPVNGFLKQIRCGPVNEAPGARPGALCSVYLVWQLNFKY